MDGGQTYVENSTLRTQMDLNLVGVMKSDDIPNKNSNWLYSIQTTKKCRTKDKLLSVGFDQVRVFDFVKLNM